MKKIISVLALSSAMSAALTGCANLQQTPIAQQEPLSKKSFDVQHQEDRITLLFDKTQGDLNGEQRSKIKRFVSYYKAMDPMKTDFLISVIHDADIESATVPVYSQYRQNALMDVKQLLHESNVEFHIMDEMDIHPDAKYTEAMARRAIMATATENELLEGLEPEMEDLERPYKLALVVRKYDIHAANCPQVGGIDWGQSKPVSSGIHVGCSVNEGLIAQIKDKTHVVYGDKTEATFASEYEVKRLNDYYKGEYSGESNVTENVQQQF